MKKYLRTIDPHELRLFLDMGGHEKVCPIVVVNVVRWAIEIYEES